jgi:cytochrome c-type biogenesis protein
MILYSLTDEVLKGSVLVAFPISIFAGLVAFISPCVLPLVPAYLAYVTGLTGAELESPLKRRRVIVGTFLFVFGFSSVFISYGALFGGAGNQLLTRERGISQILGIFTIIMGLLFLGVIKNTRQFRPRLKTDGGLFFAPFLGVLFAIGWTPCIGPTLAAVQALAFNEESAVRGAVLSLGYCIGLGLPFLLVSFGISRAIKTLKRLPVRALSIIGGVSLILLGIAQLTGFWSGIENWLQRWASSFVVAL